MKRVVLVAMLVSCGGQDAGQDWTDGGTSADGGLCTLTISFDPPQPFASSVAPIRARASLVGAPGVYTYSWSVGRVGGSSVSYTFEASDQSQIGFFAPIPDTYRVSVQVSGPVPDCNYQSAQVNVLDPMGATNVYRLRTVPSPSMAPPQEVIVQLQGNLANYNRDISLDPGIVTNGAVRNGASAVSAYMKFSPISSPLAFTETYSTTIGYSVRLLGGNHNVLIIPASTNLAPKLAAWMPGVTDFSVGPGTVVTGNVRNPSGGALANAKIQLFAGGVPSTIGTTDSSGNFAVRTDFSSAAITVKVTPPAGTGLPRLEATSAFNLAQPLQVDYASSLVACDLGGNAVRRSNVNQANAKVTLVGTMTGVGTIGGISAAGSVHVATTANGSGVLPTTLVPRAALSAAVEVAAGDFAVDAVDTTSCAAQTIDAPPRVTRTGTTKTATTNLAGVRIEATPIGVLAQADAQPVVATSGANGAFSIDLAAGGRYDVRFVDPQARAAQLAIMNTTTLPATATLPKAQTIYGDVRVTTIANPVVGASVQLLCVSCTGIEATRPIAQTATDSASHYRVAVPDPGLN